MNLGLLILTPVGAALIGWAVAELAVALAGGLMTIAIGRSSLRRGAPGRRTAGGVQS
jgi:hypothetical protein